MFYEINTCLNKQLADIINLGENTVPNSKLWLLV